MPSFADIALGFQIAFSLESLLFCFIGVTVGTFVGVLPGIGALATISMALPITFYLDPTIALIMLAGIFYGAQYGSSTASILLNIPGTATSAVTCLDGYPMAQHGRAGAALFITTICSFIGGSFAILLLMGFAPVLAEFALRFSSVEYFSVMLFALIAASTLSVGSPLKGIAMVVVGLWLGTIGTDLYSGQHRYTFGSMELMDGLSLVPVAMGLFGIAEILNNLNSVQGSITTPKVTLRSLIPTREDVRLARFATLRGSLIGALGGALPGSGPTMSAFVAYAMEKQVARDPSRFGRGAVEGIAAPEAANNASVQAAFIPTLSLGIPGDAVMAILLGAMLIHGITPGPGFVTEHPEIFWGLIASFWVGNAMLLILNIPLIGIWVRLLAIPYNILYLTMLFFICIGAYSAQNNIFDIFVALLFGVIGYGMLRQHYPPAPLLLGLILGPLLEEHFRRAMLYSRGDFTVFVERPISAAFLMSILLLLAYTHRARILTLIRRVRSTE